MTEEKKAKKIEAKRIKTINNSLSYLSNSAQKELGLLAVQKEENVFFCGNNIYKKIYTFKPALLNNKRLEVLKALCRMFRNRIRLSFCLKNKAGKMNAYMFMTVSFCANSYYEVRENIAAFEKEINKNICTILNIQIAPCNLENSLMFIHMNCTGEIRKIDADRIFQRKSAGALFEDIRVAAPGKFICASRYGAIYIGKNFPKDVADVMGIFGKNEGVYQMCIDFQSYEPEDKEIFRYELKNKYNQEIQDEDALIINATYLLSMLSESEETLCDMEGDIVSHYDKKGILLMPGVGREHTIQLSICTLGLSDFHSMQNVKENILSELLM